MYSAVRTQYAITDEELATAVKASYEADEYVFTAADWTSAWDESGRVEAEKRYKTAGHI